MKVSELVEQTRQVTRLFDGVVPREWGIEAMVTELTGEVGTLADEIMIKEGYRAPRNGDPIDIADDIVDILFMLVRIADYYAVDLDEAYQKMIDGTREKLLRKHPQLRAQ
jgi:NTP pyrophosphatase (non-canonical NTP hydrolase)